ncbi:MAG: F0F1 ATP synthase subunit A [Alphaproteobacteria bacterium]|nr:F0F1 ATP synthase subunit A [Alphaproteobacteria bacterium]
MADPIHQFVIQDLVPLHIGGVDLSFTNSALWMVIAAGLSSVVLTMAMSRASIVPNRLQVVAESAYSFVANMVRDNAGTEGMRFFPLIFTLFIVVLMGNALGMIPYSFTYTSHLAVTGALALFIFIFVTIVGFIRHGLHFLSLFSPEGVPLVLKFFVIPLEIISYLTRPVTLSVRLFANMMAGHLLLKVFAGFCVSLMSVSIALSLLPMAFNAVMIAFEFLIAGLQAYVFTVLTCVYLKDAIELH